MQGASFADEIGVSAGYRYSDYTTNGNGVSNSFDTDTWFAGVSWTVNEEVRLRVNQSVAIRAPNVFDLYVGINTGLVDLSTGENGLFDPVRLLQVFRLQLLRKLVHELEPQQHSTRPASRTTRLVSTT